MACALGLPVWVTWPALPGCCVGVTAEPRENSSYGAIAFLWAREILHKVNIDVVLLRRRVWVCHGRKS